MGLETAVLVKIALAASAASGVIGYLGARNNAKAAEYSAQAARDQAEVNSKITYQRRQAEAQDREFQVGVQDYNKQVAIEEFGREEQSLDRKIETLSATFANNAFNTQGSFSDLFNSEQKLFNLEASKLSAKYGLKSTGFTSQAELLQNQANRSLTLGEYESRNVLYAGANRANAFRNQASSYRLQGIGTLLGTASDMAVIDARYG